MKIFALIFFPYVFFALRQKIGRALIVLAPYLCLGLVLGAFSTGKAIKDPIFLIIWPIVPIVNIIWVRLTKEYKSFEKLPKGTFISVFFPSVTLFKHKRVVLGLLALPTCVPIPNVFAFLANSLSNYLKIHDPDPVAIFWLSILPLLLWMVGMYFTLFALMKCIGASLTQPQQTHLPQQDKS